MMLEDHIHRLILQKNRKVRPGMAIYDDTSALMEKAEEFLFSDTAIQLVRQTTIPVIVAKGVEEQPKQHESQGGENNDAQIHDSAGGALLQRQLNTVLGMTLKCPDRRFPFDRISPMR